MKDKGKTGPLIGKSSKHEEKIANLLKSMQERKDRKRISLETRLKRMEELTKKQNKAVLAKKSVEKKTITFLPHL